MTVGQYCVHEVDVAQPQETALQAALRMRQRAVGTLVVINEAREPIGLVTDRDLMERVLAEGLEGGGTLVRDVMTSDPMTIGADEELTVALPRMRRGGFRRLPVVDQQGSLVGLLSMDDLLILFGEQIAQIGQLVGRETPRGVAEEPVLSRWDSP